jgi:hypothetical protein
VCGVARERCGNIEFVVLDSPRVRAREITEQSNRRARHAQADRNLRTHRHELAHVRKHIDKELIALVSPVVANVITEQTTAYRDADGPCRAAVGRVIVYERSDRGLIRHKLVWAPRQTTGAYRQFIGVVKV